MIDHRCGKCQWFDREHKSLKLITEPIPGKVNVGYCRKHKPVVFLAEGWYWGGWPLVDGEDFCGEFRLDEYWKD